MGWATEPAPPRYTPPPRGPGLPSGPSRTARTAALLFLVLVVGGIWALTRFDFHDLSEINLPSVDGTLGGDKSSDPPVGLSLHSMLRRGNLSPALHDLESELGGQVKLLRIEASRVDVQVVGGDGRVTVAQRRWDSKDTKIISRMPGT